MLSPKNFFHQKTFFTKKLFLPKNFFSPKLKNSNCDKTQKLKLWQLKNSNCDKTQNVKLWQNSIYDKSLKSLLVRTTWHLDNGCDVLWAAFCDSRDVLIDTKFWFFCVWPISPLFFCQYNIVFKLLYSWEVKKNPNSKQ